ncbi:MAG: hypothetical protein ACHQQS_13570 [Thermoanaerobaculales bacterium]
MRHAAQFAMAFLVLAATLAWAQVPAPPPDTPGPATPTAPQRTVTMNLDQLIDFNQERGHAEFDPAWRREAWKDPMVRLEWGIAREQWTMQRGFVGGSGIPWGVSSYMRFQSGVDPRLVLRGPWAADWHELTPQEKIGRIVETGVYAGLIIGLLHALR